MWISTDSYIVSGASSIIFLVFLLMCYKHYRIRRQEIRVVYVMRPQEHLKAQDRQRPTFIVENVVRNQSEHNRVLVNQQQQQQLQQSQPQIQHQKNVQSQTAFPPQAQPAGNSIYNTCGNRELSGPNNQQIMMTQKLHQKEETLHHQSQQNDQRYQQTNIENRSNSPQPQFNSDTLPTPPLPPYSQIGNRALINKIKVYPVLESEVTYNGSSLQDTAASVKN